MSFDAEIDGDLGSLDEATLEEIRTAFETQELLVAEVGSPDLVDPQALNVHLETGIGTAGEARFDIRRFQPGYYIIDYEEHLDTSTADALMDPGSCVAEHNESPTYVPTTRSQNYIFSNISTHSWTAIRRLQMAL